MEWLSYTSAWPYGTTSGPETVKSARKWHEPRKFTVTMCNLCNKCYTLGMPGPRPDIRCVQYLPKVHYKVPIEFLVPSGASEVIDWHQRTKTLLNVKTEIHHIIGWIHHIIWCWREIFKISYKCTCSWRNMKDTSWRYTSTCRLLKNTSHPSALSRVIHFIFRP